MPSPILVILPGRVVGNKRYANFGSSLLQDAVCEGIEASRIIGVRAIIVDAEATIATISGRSRT